MSTHIILDTIMDADIDAGCITSLYCIYRTNLDPTLLTLPHITTPPNTITGAKPQTDLALAIVPFSAHKLITERTLIEMLSGASNILHFESYALPSGNTCKGLKLVIRFSVSGYAPPLPPLPQTLGPDHPLRKVR